MRFTTAVFPVLSIPRLLLSALISHNFFHLSFCHSFWFVENKTIHNTAFTSIHPHNQFFVFVHPHTKLIFVSVSELTVHFLLFLWWLSQAGLIMYSSPLYLRHLFFVVDASLGWSLNLSKLTNCKSNRVPVLHKWNTRKVIVVQPTRKSRELGLI